MHKWYLRRIRLTRGGYDSNGCYWGVDRPLYYYEGEVENFVRSGYLRASSRSAAKSLVQHWEPTATQFYR